MTVPKAAAAQTDPGSVERTIPKFEGRAPQQQSLEIVAPTPPEPESVRIEGTFVLGAVNIEGATVFSSAELAQSFEPYLASRVGQAELYKIAADITDRYRRAGYLLSYAVVPEQAVESGIVNIRVVEGYISNVRVQGDARITPVVLSIARQLRSDRPLRTSSLERALGLIRKLPGVVVRDSTLDRSSRDPHVHVLTLVISGDRVSALAFADNRGTIDGARMRFYSSLSAASVITSGDQLQLDLFAIPSDKFRYWYGQLKASVPLASDGMRFALSASRGEQRRTLASGNERGSSRQFTGELLYPFAQSRTGELTGHVSLGDWLSEDRVGGIRIQRDRIEVARAWLEVAHLSQSRIDARFGLSQGLGLGRVTERGDPLASRPFASARFTKFDSDVQITVPLTDRLYLRADSTAQLSTRSLLAPEEFALGGSRIGRAYDFNAATGDSGFGGMAELNYRARQTKGALRDLDLFVYADGGAAFRKHPSAGLADEQWLAGVGTGARFGMLGLTWSGEISVPLRSIAQRRPVRLFFSAADSL